MFFFFRLTKMFVHSWWLLVMWSLTVPRCAVHPRRREPRSAGPLRHADGQGEAPRPGEGPGAVQVPADQRLRRQQVCCLSEQSLYARTL